MITAKLGNMRKPQEFSVYPFNDGDRTITVQSDKSIGQFDPITGKGVLNSKGSNAKYFMHLSPSYGAVPFDFPLDFVEQCKAKQLKKGDKVNGVVIIG
jgi:hypothetical protein